MLSHGCLSEGVDCKDARLFTNSETVSCVRACVGQCATKRRRKMLIITDRVDEEALTRRTGSGGVAQLLHFPLRAVDACTVNVHKNLLIVNQAVVTFVRVSLDFVGGFSHAGTSSLSLECRHTELRGFLSSLNFLFSSSDFYSPPPLICGAVRAITPPLQC